MPAIGCLATGNWLYRGHGPLLQTIFVESLNSYYFSLFYSVLISENSFQLLKQIYLT
jgi:hypothetical protein